MDKYNKIVPCQKTNLSEVRRFVREAVGQLGLEEEQANLLVLAVDEVCANLMIHSHSCNPDVSFELNIIVDEGQSVTFELVDDEMGFNISNYSEPDLNDILRKRKKGGLGLMLVHRIMDEVTYSQRHGKAVFRLVKHLA